MKGDSDGPRGSHGATSEGKLARSVRRAPQMVLVTVGEGGKGEDEGREDEGREDGGREDRRREDGRREDGRVRKMG